MVTEIQAPVAEIRKGMTREGLATRGMTLMGSREVKIPAGNALLVLVGQKAAGAEFRKWILVVGDEKQTEMIVGTFPRAAGDLSGPIKRALLAVSWAGSARTDWFEGLTFRVDSTPKLRLANRTGNTLNFSETGRAGPFGPRDALLFVGNSVGEIEIVDLEAFSKIRAANTVHLKGLANLSGRKLEIDGLPGYELLADAQDTDTGYPIKLYQLLLVDGLTYYVAQGLVGMERADDFVPEFRGVTATFRRITAR
jgi:hypothetical protein